LSASAKNTSGGHLACQRGRHPAEHKQRAISLRDDDFQQQPMGAGFFRRTERAGFTKNERARRDLPWQSDRNLKPPPSKIIASVAAWGT